MAREGITRAQVFNAADAISASAQKPTVANVRAKLGTGSYTTITALLREWNAQNIPQDAATIDVPEEVTAALGRAAEIVWKAATDHFAREIAAVRKEAEKQSAELNGELNNALIEIDALEKLITHRDELIDEAEKELTRNREEAAQHSAHHGETLRHLAETRAELKAAEARIKEQSDLLRRLVPETKTKAKTGATPKKKVVDATPAQDTKTKPLEL